MIPKYLDYTVTPADLRNMSEENVIELMIFTDRDRKDNEDAEKLYWWCIQEINFRVDLNMSNKKAMAGLVIAFFMICCSSITEIRILDFLRDMFHSIDIFCNM